MSADDGADSSVARAGDVNGDGFDDLIIGATAANGGTGAAYVVFGKASGFPAVLDLSTLDGSNGYAIDGVASGDNTGYSVSGGGDLNHDGLDDIVIGAYGANGDQGSSFVVYGSLPGEAVTRVGSDIGQTIHGGNFDDTLSGAGGDDVLDGHGGIDKMIGGAGNDTYYVDNAGDKVIETGDGENDTVYASVSYTLKAGVKVENLIANAGSTGLTLKGNEFANIVTGGDGDDPLFGGDGDDVLDGRGGHDVMTGGAGNDTYYVNTNSDKIVETGDGETDTVYARADYTLKAGVKVENLIADAGSAGLTLKGNEFDNHVTGGSGADRLFGGDGNDTLTGGAARIFSPAAPAPTPLYSGRRLPRNSAKVNDFENAIDTIAVQGSDFGMAPGALDPANFVDGTAVERPPRPVHLQ